MVEHERVAVGVEEDRLVAHAAVELVEGNALRLELRASRVTSSMRRAIGLRFGWKSMPKA